MDQNPQETPAVSQPEPPVQSGLLSAAVEQPAPEQPAPEQPAPNLDPINLATPEAPKFDLTVATSDQPPEGWSDPAPAAPVENERQRAEREWHEKNQERINAFVQKRMEANEPEVKQKPAPFVSPHVQSQTLAEMEAGRKMNDHHAGLRAIQPQRVVHDAAGAKMVPVFRPADYTQPSLKTPASAHIPTKTSHQV